MEPSKEFCPSGCGGGKGKKRGETAKKRKRQQQLQLQLQQKTWTGVWERAVEKKNSHPVVISATSFADCFSFFAFSLLQLEPGPTQIKL